MARGVMQMEASQKRELARQAKLAELETCAACGHAAGEPCNDCEGFATHGAIVDGLCAPCRAGGLIVVDGAVKVWKEGK